MNSIGRSQLIPVCISNLILEYTTHINYGNVMNELEKYQQQYNTSYSFMSCYFEKRFYSDNYHSFEDGKIIRYFLDIHNFSNEEMFQYHNTTRETLYPFWDFNH